MAHSFDEKVNNTAGIEFGTFYFVRKTAGPTAGHMGDWEPA
jgi:hypothetical protein